MQTNLILEKIPLGIIIFDESKQVISINHSGRNYFKKTNNFLLEVLSDIVVKTLDRKVSVEKIIKFSNSKNLFVWKVKTELLDYSSPQVLVVVQDKTVDSQLEQTILKAEKLAVAGQLAIGSLVEIRNPLTSARGFCQLIEQSEVHKEYIEIISRELDQIQRIVNNCSSLNNTSRPNSLELIYKKLLACIHNRVHSYKLMMVRDVLDDLVINVVEEQVNFLISNVTSLLNTWGEENAYIIITSEFSKEDSLFKLNMRIHNDIENRSTGIERLIKCQICKNNNIELEVINNNTLVINLQLPTIISQYPN
jgi:nitrogen-specific signal transduction histidine kinase